MPARILIWWLTISASGGAQLRGPIKKRDSFIQKFSKAGARRLNGFSTQTCETCRTCGTSERRDSDAVRRSAARTGIKRNELRFGFVPVRQARYLFIIKAILKDSKVVVCWIVKAFARTSASSS